MIKARGKRITTTREGKAVDTHHMMGHAGHMMHEEAVDQITLVAREVLPRLPKPRAASKQAV